MSSKVCWILLLCCTVLAPKVECYDTKYDNVNLDDIFKSKRLLNNYINCLKNVGPCTPDAKELKERLPDALESDCQHCSDKQKIGADRVIRFIVDNQPDDFKILESMYDPEGEYRRKYLSDHPSFRDQLPSTDESPTSDATEKSADDQSTEEAAAQDQGPSDGRR
ncbi:ejaculatory bulb-specific protein 3-like [Ochlerotatus camptorhynchus]|uniref:ejaculatory bulb-specific protein 3-like n=1 Tax=Ochlerotatus camptorhynchus TaxID=644619 RepID=UPI0031E1318B